MNEEKPLYELGRGTALAAYIAGIRRVLPESVTEALPGTIRELRPSFWRSREDSEDFNRGFEDVLEFIESPQLWLDRLSAEAIARAGAPTEP